MRGELVEASISANTHPGYAGAPQRLDAWLDGRRLEDARLAELHDAGRAPSTRYAPPRTPNQATAACRSRRRWWGCGLPAPPRPPASGAVPTFAKTPMTPVSIGELVIPKGSQRVPKGRKTAGRARNGWQYGWQKTHPRLPPRTPDPEDDPRPGRGDGLAAKRMAENHTFDRPGRCSHSRERQVVGARAILSGARRCLVRHDVAIADIAGRGAGADRNGTRRKHGVLDRCSR